MFKKILILLIIVIVLAVGGLVWFISAVDLNRYIPQIERLANEQAKQEVSIGNLAFSFKGGLSLEVREVAWRPIEVEGLSGTLDTFYLQLRLLPLLTGKLEISRIELVRPDIAFRIAPEATQPIEAIQEPAKEVVEAPPEVVITPSQADRSPLPPLSVDASSEGKVNPLLPRLNLDSFVIKEGKFTYQNETDPRIQSFEFEKINLRASHISLHESFDVEGS